MNYQTILTIKESEKATVELAAVEMFVGPVIVKHLRGGKPEIYRLLAQKKHINISQIYTVLEQEGELLVVEEYVDGESLGEHLQKSLLSDEQKINYALQLCKAVGFLHAMKPSVIHRDIKPSNILINSSKELKLIDFDAARQYKNAPSSNDTRLLGTVEYAPPEQFGYSQTDVRSDIYSMGVVFHEMRPTENKKLAEQWEKISEKCTSFDPKNRYQSVAELKREIEKLAAWKKNRKKKLIAGICSTAAVLVAVIALAVFLWPEQDKTEEAGNQISVTPQGTLSLAETPLPTETPVPTPTPTVTPTLAPEFPRTLEEVLEELGSRSVLVEHFYREMERENIGDFRIYTTVFERKEPIFTVTIQNLLTEEEWSLPESEFYNENNILHIRNSYMTELDAGCYKIDVQCRDAASKLETGVAIHVLVREGREDENVSKLRLIAYNNLDFYYEYVSSIHTIVANDVAVALADTGIGRILENGRVLELDYEFLMQYMEPGQEGEKRFVITLEDGRTTELKVNYKTGKPFYYH